MDMELEMEYEIIEKDGSFCIYVKGTENSLQCFATMAEAVDGMTAIAQKHATVDAAKVKRLGDQRKPMMNAELHTLCALDGGDGQLFNELATASSPPAWIPYMPVPGTYKHPTYGDVAITPARNASMVAGFSKGIYQNRIPVDAEHQTKLSGAVAWVTGMRQNDNGSVDAQVEWTERGRKMMESGGFKYFSPEFFDEWTDPATGETYRDVAVGGALTTRPFFKESALRPLVANEQGLFGSATVDTQATVVFFESYHKETVKMADQIDPQEFSELKTKFVNQTNQFAELQGKFEAADTARQAAEAQAKQFAEDLATMKAEKQTQKFSDISVKWPGEMSTHLTVLRTLAQAFGEDSEQFKSYIQHNDALVAQSKAAGLFTEVGRGVQSNGATAKDQLDLLVQKAMKESGLKYSEAFETVMQANPQLYNEYAASVRQKI